MEGLIFWLICLIAAGSMVWLLWIVIRWIQSDVEPERFRPNPPASPPGPDQDEG